MTRQHYHLAWFLFILFVPLVASFVLPSLFYDLPVKFRTHNALADETVIIELGSAEILRVTAVWIAWVGLAIIIPWLLSGTIKTKTRHWSVIALWRSFIIFSIVGSAIALADNIFSFGGGMEQIFKQLSMAPAVAIILGVKVLQESSSFDDYKRRIVVFTSLLLLVVDIVVTVTVPVLVGKAAPAIYAGLALLYGLCVLRVDWKQQAVIWIVFAIFCVFTLAYKENFRKSWIGDMFWQQGRSIRIPVADLSRDGFKAAYMKQTGNAKPMALGAPLDLSRNEWRNFSLYDPNYYNIRFLFSDEESSTLRYVFARSLHRISQLGDLANAMRLTPDTVPYLAGTTYYPLLFKPIPRFLWKDKPADNSGQIYGHRYNILHPTDKTTSANLSVITEAWINGGWTAVILSALSFGFLVYLIWGSMIGEALGVGNVVLGMAFISRGAATESCANLVVGGVIYAMLIWWLIDCAIRRIDKGDGLFKQYRSETSS